MPTPFCPIRVKTTAANSANQRIERATSIFHADADNAPGAGKSKDSSKYFSSSGGFKSVGPKARTPATET